MSPEGDGIHGLFFVLCNKKSQSGKGRELYVVTMDASIPIHTIICIHVSMKVERNSLM